MNNYQLKIYALILLLAAIFLYNIGKPFSFIVLAFLIYVAIRYTTSFAGSSWKPMKEEIVEVFVKEIKGGKHVYDLGSGDGRVVMYAARHCDYAYGIEIEPIKWFFSSIAIKLKSIKNAKIIFGSFFKKDISDADVVLLYLPQETVDRLQTKLRSLKKGVKVVSHVSKCKDLKLVKENKKDKIYVYRV